jgi:hypothetical protein
VSRDQDRVALELDAAQILNLEWLRKALAEGESDLIAGRKITVTNDEELRTLFANL